MNPEFSTDQPQGISYCHVQFFEEPVFESQLEDNFYSSSLQQKSSIIGNGWLPTESERNLVSPGVQVSPSVYEQECSFYPNADHPQDGSENSLTSFLSSLSSSSSSPSFRGEVIGQRYPQPNFHSTPYQYNYNDSKEVQPTRNFLAEATSLTFPDALGFSASDGHLKELTKKREHETGISFENYDSFCSMTDDWLMNFDSNFKDKKFSCIECKAEKLFVDSKAYAKHIRDIHKCYTCTLCNVNFHGYQRLHAHKKKYHGHIPKMIRRKGQSKPT